MYTCLQFILNQILKLSENSSAYTSIQQEIDQDSLYVAHFSSFKLC